MSQITPFKLPSDESKVIKMRDATVAQMIEFSGIRSQYEETLKTSFLNAIQEKASFLDSALWTQQDRTAAVWWWWIHTRKDTRRMIPYECQHCGESHNYYVDMRKFGAQYRVLEGQTSRDIKLDDTAIVVNPLRGAALVELESAQAVFALLGEDETGEHKARWQIELLAHKLEMPSREAALAGEKPTAQALHESRKEFIYALSSQSYDELVAAVDEAEGELAHGISAEIEDLKTYWTTDPHRCPNSTEEKPPITRLSFPFYSSEFLPRLQS